VTTGDDRDYLPGTSRPGLLPLYDAFSRLMGARDVGWELVAQAGIEPDATVLEIGCGTGNVLLLAKRAVRGAMAIGLDPDPRALAIAERKARRAGLPIQFDRGYADRLPYADGSVNRVLSAFMLHHLPTDQQHDALLEVHRVLAPGGRLHLVDFDGTPAGPVGRLLHRPRGGGHGHGRGADHGHGLAWSASAAVPGMLTAAGFVDAAEVSRGTTPMGGHAFFRAAR
jgi:SAM-dependent methyltransferase